MRLSLPHSLDPVIIQVDIPFYASTAEAKVPLRKALEEANEQAENPPSR